LATLTRSTLAAALAAMIVASVPTWVRAEDAPVAVQIVDALNKHFGVHPGFRANHAKGIVVEGSFKASPEAASLSRSPLFTGVKLPVTVRFFRCGRTRCARCLAGGKPAWYGNQVSSARRR